MAFYKFATHSSYKTLQHKRILQRYSHTHQAWTKSAHYWEVGTGGDGSLMGAIGQKPLEVATSHGIQGGLVCSAVGKHWGFNHWSPTQFPLSENTKTLPCDPNLSGSIEGNPNQKIRTFVKVTGVWHLLDWSQKILAFTWQMKTDSMQPLSSKERWK